jgi:hypothetical protein
VLADKFVGFGQEATALQQSYCWYNGSDGRTAEDPYQVLERTEHSLTTTPHIFNIASEEEKALVLEWGGQESNSDGCRSAFRDL